LERKIQSGLATEEEVKAYPLAAAELATAKAARQSALDEVFAAGVLGLPADQRALLTTMRSNGSWSLPVAYLTVERREAEWVQLRDALDARRIFQGWGEGPPDEVTSLLATVESDPTVSKATADLDAGIAAIQSAWNAAVTD
jgi:hypothetical protein